MANKQKRQPMTTIQIRLTPHQLRKVDELVKVRGTTRAALIRSIVYERLSPRPVLD